MVMVSLAKCHGADRVGLRALRDIAYLRQTATKHRAAVGEFATPLLDSPLPWTRMRQVHWLLSLVKRYGAERVDDACGRALEAERVNVSPVGRCWSGPENGGRRCRLPLSPPCGTASVVTARSSRWEARADERNVCPNPTTMSPELRQVLRRPKLGQILSTLPERLVLARQDHMPHQDFLELVLADRGGPPRPHPGLAASPCGEAGPDYGARGMGREQRGRLRPAALG